MEPSQISVLIDRAKKQYEKEEFSARTINLLILSIAIDLICVIVTFQVIFSMLSKKFHELALPASMLGAVCLSMGLALIMSRKLMSRNTKERIMQSIRRKNLAESEMVLPRLDMLLDTEDIKFSESMQSMVAFLEDCFSTKPSKLEAYGFTPREAERIEENLMTLQRVLKKLPQSMSDRKERVRELVRQKLVA